MGLTQIIKRDGRVVPFEREKIFNSISKAAQSTGGFKQDMDLLPSRLVLDLYPQYLYFDEKQITAELTEQVISYLKFYQKISKVETPSVEDTQLAVEHVLANQVFIDVWEEYHRFRWSRTAVREKKITKGQFSKSGLPDKKCREIAKWNQKHGCDTISGLNEIVKDHKEFKKLINSSIRVYKKELDNIASLYLKNPSRIVFITGPSSSGKTTTTDKLVKKLKKEGRSCKLWTLDNYFFGGNVIPPDEFGDYNYEIPEALDISLIQNHLYQLFEGKEIKVPHYIFGVRGGERKGISGKMKLEEDEVLIVDCLYSISPKVFPDELLPEKAFKVYIETLNMIENSQGRKVKLTDNRLLRRTIRDVRPLSEGGRGYAAKHTLGHWHYVRNGELMDLIPYMNTADYIINGGLAFELPILKEKLYNIMPELEQFKKQKRWDAVVRGHRIKKLFDELIPTSDEHVPLDCHLREFIGGLKLK
jgi:uridine kinase